MTVATCPQPGCGGTIEDGFCTVCGLAPASPAQVSPVPAVPAQAVPAAAMSASVSTGQGTSGTSPFGTAGSASGPGTRGSRRGSGRSSRGRLGAGLVAVPPVPYVDPASAVLTDPRVPESRRFCGNCGRLVGQPANGKPGLTEGFCPHCGTRYSFSPKLAAGELVNSQYEVLGCLAHGGLGWIYLARDRNVSNRWVVLKGLLNTGDPDAMEAAVAESWFLARLEHPHIVRIYNFVEHTSRADGETSGYIVMEYVGGKSLKQIRLAPRAGASAGQLSPGQPSALQLPHALAYALEILPAFGYLHDRGLVYCDFKPDNIIQTEEQLKLIDLGAVREIDGDGPIYGTVGYQAPEIETDGPSPSSDLYTVGRCLAVLTFDFIGFQGQYKFTLPEAEPILVQQESYARLLRRATHADPGRRFQTAGEMAEQLTGVLREVMAVSDGQPRPAFSGLFSPEVRAVGTDLSTARPPAGAPQPAAVTVPRPSPADVLAGLPVPLVDGTDPAAGYLATLAGAEPAQQAQTLLGVVTGDAGVPSAVADSPETKLALVRALIGAGDLDTARGYLAELAAPNPGPASNTSTGVGSGPADWRITWFTGLASLAAGQSAAARAAFRAVYDELPGELAPKLALGFAAEAAGDVAAARRYFQLVWTVDRSYVSAGFGLARACLAAGDRPAAIAAVAAVPETSSHYLAAQIAAVRLLVAGGGGPGQPSASQPSASQPSAGQPSAGQLDTDLRQADLRLGRLSLEDNDPRRHQLTIEILRAALDLVTTSAGRNGAPRPAVGRILGCEPNERSLRFGLERGYRALATLIPERRVELVDLANSVRPRTWL